jgi:flagellar biosynthesis GTPase FlhF
MSSGSQFHSTAEDAARSGVAGGGEVRTYRGRTVEELIPRIRAELGEGAIILRERQGLSGGVGGFFAQRCVEIQAQAGPRVSVYAGDDLEPELTSAPVTAAAPAASVPAMDLADIDEERELSESEFEAAAMPAARAARPQAVVPPALAQLPEVRAFAGALQAAATVSVPVPVPVPGTFTTAPAQIELRSPNVPGTGNFQDHTPVPADVVAEVPTPQEPQPPRPSFRAQPVTPAGPAFEPFEIPVPIAIEPLQAPVEPMGPFRVARAAAAAPAPVTPPALEATPVPEAPPVAVPVPAPNLLAQRLAARGMTPAFAEAISDGVPDRASLEAHLTAILPAAAALASGGGAIAVVGSGGTGKTRVVAALAAAAARAGRHVSVARLGVPERQLELAELLRDEAVEVLPAMRTRATARAVASAREQGLVIVDTTSANPSDRSAMEILAEALGAFAFDGVLLTVPATFASQAAGRLADGFAALPLTGLVATHADESGDLGAIAELSIRRRLPIGHVHSGVDVASALQAVDPAHLAGQLLR